MTQTRREFLKKMTASWHAVPKLVRYPVNIIATGAIAYPAIAGLADLALTIAVNAKDLPHKEEGLAVLISYGTHQMWDTAMKYPNTLFIPAYVGSIELAFEQRADIVKKAATKQDLLDVLVDESIQNVVLFGHGSWNSWLATDQEVKVNDLYKYRFSLYKNEVEKKKEQRKTNFKKNGLLVRHTCGLNQMVDKSYFKSTEKDWKEFMHNASSLGSLVFKISNGEIRISSGIQATNSYSREGERDSIGIDYQFYNSDNKVGVYNPANRKIVQIKSPDDVKRLHDQIITDLFARNKPLNDNWKEQIADYIKPIQEYINNHYIVGPWENEVLGRPFYSRKNIRGWSGVSTPLHFLLNPLGNNN